MARATTMRHASLFLLRAIVLEATRYGAAAAVDEAAMHRCNIYARHLLCRAAVIARGLFRRAARNARKTPLSMSAADIDDAPRLIRRFILLSDIDAITPRDKYAAPRYNAPCLHHAVHAAQFATDLPRHAVSYARR